MKAALTRFQRQYPLCRRMLSYENQPEKKSFRFKQQSQFGSIHDQRGADKEAQIQYRNTVLSQIDEVVELSRNTRMSDVEVEANNDQVMRLLPKILASFGQKSTVDTKTQVYILNKLAKEKQYTIANQSVLLPLWKQIANYYIEFKNLVTLQKEQIGILVWSLGHIDLEVVNKNYKLWNSIEMFTSNSIGLQKLNNFTISQLTYGFSKSGNGTSLYWRELEEIYIDRVNQFDKLGVAIMINSFGRSSEAQFNKNRQLSALFIYLY